MFCQSCGLPELPDRRAAASLSGLEVCGGHYTRTNCLSLQTDTDPSWQESHTLSQPRRDHIAWQVELGGYINCWLLTLPPDRVMRA